MTRIAGALIGGLVLGVLAVLAVNSLGSKSQRAPMEAGVTRTESPISVTELFASPASEDAAPVSLNDVLSLPTVFERVTALHLLAATPDASDVQNLVFETNELVGEFERENSLVVLFERLTELNPRTALNLARSDDFSATKAIEQAVWRTWARNDFDEALFEAKTQTSLVNQKSAAQSFYAAFGYMGNATTDRIEAELGIEPDRSARSRYLYSLADRSIGDAIDFINNLEDVSDRRRYASWLAHYVSLSDPNEALIYAGRFNDASASEYFEYILNQNIAQEDPHSAIERLRANGNTGRLNGEYSSAVSALAKIDLATAKQYFEQARTNDDRRLFGSAIAAEMAKKDPSAAIAWARDNESANYPFIMMSVIGQIAQTDPQLALSEALQVQSRERRSDIVSNLVVQIAHKDPQKAVALIEGITDREQKKAASLNLASAWVRRDSDGAIDWILSQGSDIQGDMLQMAASRLVHNDVDAAIRLLPRLSETAQRGLRQQIAQRLATNISPLEAQNFVQQFENEPGYEQLQASLISGVAENDVLTARQMAEQLPSGDARDRAYFQVISKRAEDDPAEAARWLSRIDNDVMRGSATGQIASQWALTDPASAERWVTELPAGQVRDDAILHLSFQWSNTTAAQDSLIASMDNREKRGQAKVRRAYNLMHTDVEKARAILKDEDISETQRQQAELMLSRMGLRY